MANGNMIESNFQQVGQSGVIKEVNTQANKNNRITNEKCLQYCKDNNKCKAY